MNGPTRQPPPVWEPEPLQLPIEAPHRRTRRPLPPGASESDDDTAGDDLRPDENRPGSHVIVIDIG
jgi:hypothetical protein